MTAATRRPVGLTRAAFLRRWRANIAQAEEVLLRDGVIAPLVTVVGNDEAIRLLPLDLRDDAARARSVDMVRLLAVSSDAVLVVLCAEVWAVADGGAIPEGVAPSESDRRVEALAVAVMGRVDSAVERRLSLREILREASGRPVGLRDLARAGGAAGSHGGWMLDLLAPRRPNAGERALAAVLLATMTRRGC
jgi:hypothetical protein